MKKIKIINQIKKQHRKEIMFFFSHGYITEKEYNKLMQEEDKKVYHFAFIFE